MLKSIEVKNVATYSPEGSNLEDLQPINFIYGANGSGKTTISNYLTQLDEPKYTDCKLIWEHNQPLKAHVYNKDFREQNFFKADIPGVFTLGKASAEQLQKLKEKQEEIKELRKQASEERRRLAGFDNQLKLESERFRETAWELFFKKLKPSFSDAFKGCSTKEPFKNRLLQEYKSNKAELHSQEALEKQAVTLFGEVPNRIEPLAFFKVKRLLEIEESPVWQKPIIGKSDVPIAALIQELGNSDWVDKGQKFIIDNTCPFCQQPTIDVAFKMQLEQFFDESYKNSVKEIEELEREYIQLANQLKEELSEYRDREAASADTKLNWEILDTESELMFSQMNEIMRLINDKIKEPGHTVKVVPLTESYKKLSEHIKQANDEIEVHNQMISTFSESHSSLIKLIWRYIIEEAKPTIESHLKASSGITAARSKLVDEQNSTNIKGVELKKEIEELTKGAAGVEFSELEMNKTLSSYGFHSFRIVKSKVKDNCYQIQREDGTLVESTLSEGEVTFITFLYYYQLAKGGHSEDSVNERRILVVDDPISSLDSNVMFVVSSLLRKIIEDIRSGQGHIPQLILLTHNTYFHKQLSIVDGRKQELKDTAYWLLRKGAKWTSIESHGRSNPISSTYELLWKELRSENKISNVMLQNAMRRILEYYFTVFGQFSNIKKLPYQFETIEEQIICKSLLSWVNDGSHDIADEIHVSDYDGTDHRYKEVFRALFEANNQIGHYNQMMGIEEGIVEEQLKT